jgi:hypothetical protein
VSVSRADLVWNRACDGGGRTPGPGDAALAALLLCHGYAMNGGVFHALDGLDERELANAMAGFRLFEMGKAADLLDRARLTPPAERGPAEAAFDAEYAKLASDAALDKHFRRQFDAHPEWFSPLDA